MYECSRSLLIVGEPFVSRAEQTLNVRSTRASFVAFSFLLVVRLRGNLRTFSCFVDIENRTRGRSQRMLRL